MSASAPLWSETAIAVRRVADGEVVIVAEGTLWDVVKAVRVAPLRYEIRVSLPDRRVPPMSYAGKDLADLLGLAPSSEG